MLRVGVRIWTDMLLLKTRMFEDTFPYFAMGSET